MNPPRQIAAQSILLTELPEVQFAPESSAAIADCNPLHDVKARLQVRVGEFELTVGELLSAKVGQVFTLDRTLDQAIDLLLEGRVVMRGQLVAVEGHFGVRLTELPVPLKP